MKGSVLQVSAVEESLRGLLEQVLRDRDMTVRGFGEHVEAQGLMSRELVRQISKGYVPKKDSKLDAFADATGLSRDRVHAAAGRKSPPGKPFVEELPDGVNMLDRTERDALIHVIRVMVDRRRSKGDEPGSGVQVRQDAADPVVEPPGDEEQRAWDQGPA